MKKRVFFLYKFCFVAIIIFLFIFLICFAVYVCSMPSFMIRTPAYATVCIDPGHGGKDTGASFKSRKEKDDVLLLSNKIKKQLEKSNINVIMTRDKDRFISLEERCKIANQAKCDLFVSIHRNSSSSGSGIEIWIKNEPSAAEEHLAENIESELEKTKHISAVRGIKKGFRKNAESNYYVNANTEMPSCLAEIGFITSHEDNALFDQYIEEYAVSIANGIVKTLNEMQRPQS